MEAMVVDIQASEEDMEDTEVMEDMEAITMVVVDMVKIYI